MSFRRGSRVWIPGIITYVGRDGYYVQAVECETLSMDSINTTRPADAKVAKSMVLRREPRVH